MTSSEGGGDSLREDGWYHSTVQDNADLGSIMGGVTIRWLGDEGGERATWIAAISCAHAWPQIYHLLALLQGVAMVTTGRVLLTTAAHPPLPTHPSEHVSKQRQCWWSATRWYQGTVIHCQVGEAGHSLVGVHQTQQPPEKAGVTASLTETSTLHVHLHHFHKEPDLL